MTERDQAALYFLAEFERMTAGGYRWEEATRILARDLIYDGRRLQYGGKWTREARFRQEDIDIIRPLDGELRQNVLLAMSAKLGISVHGARHRLQQCELARLVEIRGWHRKARVHICS